MKIINNLVNPTVEFSRLSAGQVFMTLNGDVYIKSEMPQPIERWAADKKNAFSLTLNAMFEIEGEKEVVPVEAELSLLRNIYERYNTKK